MKNKKGFTLIELLAAVLVIGVLSSIAVPQYQRSIERARMTEGIQMLPAIYDSVQRWQAENPEASSLPSWNLLDVSMKGKPGPAYNWNGQDNPVWLTPNFAYMIHVPPPTSNKPEVVMATVRKGKYRGNGFVYMPYGTERGGRVGDAHVYCMPTLLTAVPNNGCDFMGYRSEDSSQINIFEALTEFSYWMSAVYHGLYDAM